MNLCEKCKQNPANVRFSQTLGGKTTTMHLCSACAAKMGIGISKFGTGEDLFPSFPLFSHIAPKRDEDAFCPRCHTTLSQIRKKGVFGCSECYDTFAKKLDLKPFVGQGYRGGRLGKAPQSEKKRSFANKTSRG